MSGNHLHKCTAGLLLTLMIGGASTLSCSKPAAGDQSLGEASAQRRGHLDWGLYQILWSRRYGEILEKELKRFSSPPRYVTFYRDLGRPFPKRAVDAIAGIGATSVVSLELWTWHHGRGKVPFLPAINAGEYDDFLREWAVDAKRDGRRLLLRYGFEFNGDWFSWSGDPAAFVSAWRRAREIFRKVGADNVEWVWAPNIVSVPDRPENNMHLYYPGDEFVDWIGVDGYNFGDHHDKWHVWQSFEQIYADVLPEFQKRYADKPVLITEFGCAPGKPGQRRQWILDAYRTLERYPQVRAVIWFNYDKTREKEPNWRLDEADGSLKAFNETFARPPANAKSSPAAFPEP
jgi:hypothetical protein